jgi:hypothetical protein
VVAILGLLFSAVLALRMNLRELAVLAGTLAAGVVHWLWMRPREGGWADGRTGGTAGRRNGGTAEH